MAVFVKTPNIADLKARLQLRGTDTEEKIAMRIAKAETELERAVDFDHIVLNDKLETAKKDVQQLVFNFLNQ
ncbi:MAG: Guanylate kinase [Bacteroidota bacterium]|nr:MAG: Guanylate kinase [Bacteroidota bacterium]